MENNKVLDGVRFVIGLILRAVCFFISRDLEKEREQQRPLNEE